MAFGQPSDLVLRRPMLVCLSNKAVFLRWTKNTSSESSIPWIAVSFFYGWLCNYQGPQVRQNEYSAISRIFSRLLGRSHDPFIEKIGNHGYYRLG